jgi:hypothetical protein
MTSIGVNSEALRRVRQVSQSRPRHASVVDRSRFLVYY